MKFSDTVVCAVALLAHSVQSHYIFQQLTVNGKKGGVYEHVRKNLNQNSPVTDLASYNLRCNVGCNTGGSTSTEAVAAGSPVTWSSDVKVYHQGPVSFYMTKVPNAAEADGSTKWFKIKDIGPTFSGKGGNWDATQQQSFNVAIPKCIPAGEYLLRIQQMAIHNPGGAPQFYVSCAQLKVSGGGNVLPSVSHLVNIPGAFHKTDPGYNVNIYNNFRNYTIPGPPVFSC